MILFKHDTLTAQFDELDGRLRHVVFALAGFIQHAFGKDLVITSIYRDQVGSTHRYLRAVDFRVQPLGQPAIYTDEEIEQIKKFCATYVYDRKRPGLNTLRVHDAGTGLHGHLQINGFGITEMIDGD